jgi:hypothetical protein
MYDRIIDYLINRRWLVLVAGAGTLAGIAVEILEKISNTAVEAQGVGVWQALPLLLAAAGQIRANSNRYVDDVRESFRVGDDGDPADR